MKLKFWNIFVTLCGFALLFILSCIDNPDFPDTPEIEYIGISKLSMDQNSLNTDSIFLRFSFTDGDGDIGHEAEDITQNIILTDTRTDQIYDSYKAPSIPPQGASKGISGEVTVRVFTTCCLFPENIPPCESPPQYPTDTLILEVYMLDRAGNESNRIFTEPIVIRCN